MTASVCYQNDCYVVFYSVLSAAILGSPNSSSITGASLTLVALSPYRFLTTSFIYQLDFSFHKHESELPAPCDDRFWWQDGVVSRMPVVMKTPKLLYDIRKASYKYVLCVYEAGTNSRQILPCHRSVSASIQVPSIKNWRDWLAFIVCYCSIPTSPEQIWLSLWAFSRLLRFLLLEAQASFVLFYRATLKVVTSFWIFDRRTSYHRQCLKCNLNCVMLVDSCSF